MNAKKLLFDTDIGGNIDDAICLAYLLREPRSASRGGNESRKIRTFSGIVFIMCGFSGACRP